jgi:hypothetical protein
MVSVIALFLSSACSDPHSPGGGVPSAQLSVPVQAVLGARILVDARDSRDPEGKLLRFRYDFNDGTPSVVTGASSTHHVFVERGYYHVCVAVTDLDGLTAKDCHDVTVVLAPDLGLPDSSADADTRSGDSRADLLDLPRSDAKVDLPKPDLAKPDLSKPDLPKPDLSKPDMAKPDLAKPDLAQPDLSPSDLKPDAGTCYTPEVGGSGASGYSLKLVPACHPSIGSAGTKLGIGKDEAGVLTILPFTFSYFGKTAIAAGVSANGYLQLVGSNPLALLEPIPVAIPSSSSPNNLIAAFWDNLAPASTTSDVWVATLGQAPKRVYVIEWQGWGFSNAAPAELVFSVFLYEGSNVIELQYSKLVGGSRATGSAASIGIENETGSLGLQHAYQKAGAVSTSQGIRFVPK